MQSFLHKEKIDQLNFWISKLSKQQGLSVQISYINQPSNSNIAWIEEKTGAKVKDFIQSLYINVPIFIQLYQKKYNRPPSYEEIFQISVHEYKHVYEQACLDYR